MVNECIKQSMQNSGISTAQLAAEMGIGEKGFTRSLNSNEFSQRDKTRIMTLIGQINMARYAAKSAGDAGAGAENANTEGAKKAPRLLEIDWDTMSDDDLVSLVRVNYDPVIRHMGISGWRLQEILSDGLSPKMRSEMVRILRSVQVLIPVPDAQK